MAYGYLGFIGVAKEAGWGSGTAASSGDFIEALSEDITATMERFTYKAMIASMGEPDDAVGLLRVAGNIRFAAHPVTLGHALKSVLHSQTQTTVLSGFLHTCAFQTTSGGADFDSSVPNQPYSIEVFRDVTSSFRYTGWQGNELELSFGEGAVMCNWAGIAKAVEVVSKSTPTFPTSSSKPFTFETVSLSLGGAGTALIEQLSVKVSNGFEGLGALNLSQYIAKVRRNNHQTVEITGSLDFSNLTEYNNFINQTEQRLVISATRAASFQLIVDVPRMVYTAFPTGVPGRERLMVSFTGKGFVHTGSGTAIKVSLTTTKSMY